MQDRYVADVGDFGKYGLLRALSKSPRLKLGVIWYLVPDDGREEFRNCDEDLFKRLQTIKGKRRVSDIERSGILPKALFYSNQLNKTNRIEWQDKAFSTIKSCNLVFLDPDNGITSTNPNSPLHATIKELGRFFEKGKRSLIVYHHLGRNGKHQDQIKRWADEIRGYLGVEPIPLWYRRGTSRVFYVIPAPRHQKELVRKAKKFLEGPWGQHFTKL